jgi:hypothetical protein
MSSGPIELRDSSGLVRFEGLSSPPPGGGSMPVYTPVSITDADSPYTAAAGDLVVADDTDTGITINLPDSPTEGDQITVWLPETASTSVTVTTTDGSTIDGASSISLNNGYAQGTFVFVGAGQWASVVPPLNVVNALVQSNGYAPGQSLSGLSVMGATTTITQQVDLFDDLTTPTAESTIIVGTADPSAGGGVIQPLGSLYLRKNDTAGELWCKTGAGNTAWTKVTP